MAAEYLSGAGYGIVARNWRHGRGEIDIVARDGEALVFVEVKTRGRGALVPGYYAVGRKKKGDVRRCAQAYLRQLRKKPRTFRFDIVEVTLDEDDYKLQHYSNIALFNKHYQG